MNITKQKDMLTANRTFRRFDQSVKVDGSFDYQRIKKILAILAAVFFFVANASQAQQTFRLHKISSKKFFKTLKSQSKYNAEISQIVLEEPYKNKLLDALPSSDVVDAFKASFAESHGDEACVDISLSYMQEHDMYLLRMIQPVESYAVAINKEKNGNLTCDTTVMPAVYEAISKDGYLASFADCDCDCFAHIYIYKIKKADGKISMTHVLTFQQDLSNQETDFWDFDRVNQENIPIIFWYKKDLYMRGYWNGVSRKTIQNQVFYKLSFKN